MHLNRAYLIRAVAVGVVCVVSVGACSPSPDPGRRGAESPGAPQLVEPEGELSTLEPVEGVGGEVVTVVDGLSLILPEGTVREDRSEGGAQQERMAYRMPDADSEGVPVIQVTYFPRAGGAGAESSMSDWRMQQNPAVSDYVRSPARWPGAGEAYVESWTQEIATSDGSLVVDCLSLWVDTPNGLTAVVLAMALHGELEGSTALTALRTLRVG